AAERQSGARTAADVLKRDIDAILAAPAAAHALWGVMIKSLQTGETLYAANARTLLMPASNMKIVTLAAAADRLGWDYTYQTMLFMNGPIEAGILQGDLVVVGSGDPSIGEATNPFADWAEQLKSRGV